MTTATLAPLPAGRAPILVVDDDPGIREAFDAMLGDEYEVCLAADVAGALRVLRTRAPRVAFVDLRLGNESGLDLLRTMSAEGSSVPVVVVTAATDERALMQSRALGAAGIVRKPFDVSEVEAIARASTCNR